MVWDIFETIVNLFESYIIVRFISRVQGYKYIGIIKYITFALAVLISFFELNLMNNMVSFEGVAIFIPIVTMYIYAYFCLKGDNFRKIFISILVMVLIIIINSFVAFLVSFLTGTNLNGLISQKNIYRLITIILTKMIFFIVTTLAIKFLKTETNSLLGNKEWFVVLFSPIVSIFLCVQIININISLALEREKLIQVVLLFICIVLVNISNYYLFLKISKIGRTKEELDFLKQRYDCQIKGLDDIKITYCEIRKLRHDLQNNMFCILALLEQGNYIKAAEYANNLSERIEKTKVFVGTDSEAINCMINLKLKTAEEKEINFKYDIVEHLGKINEVDTCILIANLLDNAIEACQNINKERRIIELIICRRGQELLITIKNCINKSVLENNPDLTTKKKDNKFHGLGRLSAKSIVERYSGNLIYYERSGFFCCEAKLYFPNEIREPHLVTCEEKVKF